MTRLKFCWEPVATVTEKVASCGWCFHGNHPQWPSEAERENVEKGRKKMECLRNKTDEVVGKRGNTDEGKWRATPAVLFSQDCLKLIFCLCFEQVASRSRRGPAGY